LTLLRHTTCHR